MEEENRECGFPEELKKYYMCLFLGKRTTWMDENRIIHTIYEYPSKPDGDNKAEVL